MLYMFTISFFSVRVYMMGLVTRPHTYPYFYKVIFVYKHTAT